MENKTPSPIIYNEFKTLVTLATGGTVSNDNQKQTILPDTYNENLYDTPEKLKNAFFDAIYIRYKGKSDSINPLARPVEKTALENLLKQDFSSLETSLISYPISEDPFKWNTVKFFKKEGTETIQLGTPDIEGTDTITLESIAAADKVYYMDLFGIIDAIQRKKDIFANIKDDEQQIAIKFLILFDCVKVGEPFKSYEDMYDQMRQNWDMEKSGFLMPSYRMWWSTDYENNAYNQREFIWNYGIDEFYTKHKRNPINFDLVKNLNEVQVGDYVYYENRQNIKSQGYSWPPGSLTGFKNVKKGNVIFEYRHGPFSQMEVLGFQFADFEPIYKFTLYKPNYVKIYGTLVTKNILVKQYFKKNQSGGSGISRRIKRRTYKKLCLRKKSFRQSKRGKKYLRKKSQKKCRK